MVSEPTSFRNVEIQKNIMNTHPAYNLLVLKRELMTDEEIMEENKHNFELGEQMFHIQKHDEIIGILTYLPRNPHDLEPWIGLLVIHKDHEGNGLGSEVLRLFEEMLREQDVRSVRLGVQVGNEKGASFWTKNGFTIIRGSVDEYGNQVDIYEKQL
jgi:ribosomal protein S18 acetylase RimI-like enzyme